MEQCVAAKFSALTQHNLHPQAFKDIFISSQATNASVHHNKLWVAGRYIC